MTLSQDLFDFVGGPMTVIEFAVVLILGLLILQGIKLLLARGIFLGSRRKTPQHDAKRRPVQQRWGTTRTEQETQSRQQPEQDRGTERWRQRKREWAAKQSEGGDWWKVLEVSQYASADEIRRSYLVQIKQTHPDRVVWLAPELLSMAEGRAKTLNAAYAEAIRTHRSLPRKPEPAGRERQS